MHLVRVHELRNAQSTYLIVNQRRRSDIHELVYMLSVDFISYVSADVISTMSRDRLNSGQLIYVYFSGWAKVPPVEVSTYVLSCYINCKSCSGSISFSVFQITYVTQLEPAM